MVEGAFLLATLLSLATGLAYASVGRHLSRRRVEGPSRLASSLFATWWFALAGMTLAGALARLGAAAGVVDLPAYLAWVYVALLLLCVALWGLLYYLVYLLTGSRRALAPVTAFYAALYAWLVHLVAAGRPVALDVGTWAVTLEYARPPEGSALVLALGALLGPPLAAAMGYFRLFFKVEGRTQRYRIGLVSVTLFTWFLSAILAAFAELDKAPWWPLVSGLVGLAAAALIHVAYQPPRWVRRRYGVAAVDETPPA